MVARSDHVPGYAVGGLSGGEAKDEFWKVVSLCTSLLPEEKPRYCMGVGFAEDLLVCVALGVDMVRLANNPPFISLTQLHLVQADCVFPTRTGRCRYYLIWTKNSDSPQYDSWGRFNLRWTAQPRTQKVYGRLGCHRCRVSVIRSFFIQPDGYVFP